MKHNFGYYKSKNPAKNGRDIKQTIEKVFYCKVNNFKLAIKIDTIYFNLKKQIKNKLINVKRTVLEKISIF